MWPELREQIAVEERQLQQLVEMYQPLLVQCRTSSPNPIELSALATFLHSLYTGIENVLRRVSKELGESPPRGDAWHRLLLNEMAEPGPGRPEVISPRLRDRLKPYLQFRHVFRHSYTFQLDWDKMAPLVLEAEQLLAEVRSDLASFVGRMDSPHES